MMETLFSERMLESVCVCVGARARVRAPSAEVISLIQKAHVCLLY